MAKTNKANKTQGNANSGWAYVGMLTMFGLSLREMVEQYVYARRARPNRFFVNVWATQKDDSGHVKVATKHGSDPLKAGEKDYEDSIRRAIFSGIEIRNDGTALVHVQKQFANTDYGNACIIGELQYMASQGQRKLIVNKNQKFSSHVWTVNAMDAIFDYKLNLIEEKELKQTKSVETQVQIGAAHPKKDVPAKQGGKSFTTVAGALANPEAAAAGGTSKKDESFDKSIQLAAPGTDANSLVEDGKKVTKIASAMKNDQQVDVRFTKKGEMFVADERLGQFSQVQPGFPGFKGKLDKSTLASLGSYLTNEGTKAKDAGNSPLFFFGEDKGNYHLYIAGAKKPFNLGHLQKIGEQAQPAAPAPAPKTATAAQAKNANPAIEVENVKDVKSGQPVPMTAAQKEAQQKLSREANKKKQANDRSKAALKLKKQKQGGKKAKPAKANKNNGKHKRHAHVPVPKKPTQHQPGQQIQ